MVAPVAQPAFPFGRAALLLSATAALIMAASCLTVWLFHPGDQVLLATVLYGGSAVWLAALLGMVPVAVLGRRGVMPTVYGYFIGMGLRLVLVMGAAMAVVHTGRLPGRPMAVVLAVFYLPLLLVEVGLVGRYLWRKDFLPRPDAAHPRPGADSTKEVTA